MLLTSIRKSNCIIHETIGIITHPCRNKLVKVAPEMEDDYESDPDLSVCSRARRLFDC